MPENISIELPKLLLGEGEDEVQFFKALLRHVGKEDIQPLSYGGTGQLGSYIKTLPLVDNFDTVVSIGVTRDADQNPEGAFDSVANFLNRNSFASPENPGEIAQGNPSTGIFILPGDERQGELETLCLDALDDDPAIECVNEFFRCAEGADCSPNKPDKAKLYAWLTTRSSFCRRLGIAAQNGQVPFDSPAFSSLRNFVLSL